ncbi:hypothetical protein WN51_10062 [Melipona quadrifasciata]|uniref:Cyclin N-terminal domain-containing protein n=1 Tax=Melipona quadrifasciata TaxID=166423 RepID=A0A0M9ABH3_9HYME|nr:hypothetical protein WN51_10062 [Melipona quadrifasciata]
MVTPIDRSSLQLAPTPIKVVNRRNKLNVTNFNENNLLEPRNDLQEEVSPFTAELLYHGEYHNDLPIIEREREKRSSKLSANFLTEHINAEQRRLVVVFMIRLGIHCRYPSYIVYQSVKLFDAIMDKISVETMFIQLAALASLWIALKKQENFDKIPTATDIVALAKDLYIGREDLLKAYERKILRILDFNITFADAFSLFTHHLIDVTLLDEQFCRTSVNLIVRTAMELVLGLVLDLTADSATPRWLFWRGLLFAAIPRPIDRVKNSNRIDVSIKFYKYLSGYLYLRIGGVSSVKLSTNPDCFDDKSYPSSKERSDGLNSKFRDNSPVPNLVSVENNSYEEETFISDNDLISELIEENLMEFWRLTENIRDLNEEILIHSYKSNFKEIIIEKSNKIATFVKFLFRILKENTEMNEQKKIKKSSINVGIQVSPSLDYGPPVIPRRSTVNPQSTPDSYPMPSNVIMKSLPKQLYAQSLWLDERPQSPEKCNVRKLISLPINMATVEPNYYKATFEVHTTTSQDNHSATATLPLNVEFIQRAVACSVLPNTVVGIRYLRNCGNKLLEEKKHCVNSKQYSLE